MKRQLRKISQRWGGAGGLGLCLLAFSAGAEINLTSTALEIWGDWQETWYTEADHQEHHNAGTFGDFTLSEPSLSLTAVSSPYGWGGASGTLSAFDLRLSADAAPWDIFYEWGIGSLQPTEINIYATATTRFQVEHPVLEIQWSGRAHFDYFPNEQEVYLVLTDVTTATPLLQQEASVDWDEWGWGEFTAVYPVTVMPAHEYELTLAGWITAWDAKYALLEAGVMIREIPEPASGWLLFMGWGLALARRQAGLRAYIISAFCLHDTAGLDFLPASFWQGYLYRRRKWRAVLPVKTPCITITRFGWPIVSHTLRSAYTRYVRGERAGRRINDPAAFLERRRTGGQTSRPDQTQRSAPTT